jgi:hypothetical protein
MDELGAGSRRGVEAFTEVAIDVLQVHGSDASTRRPGGGLLGHGGNGVLEDLAPTGRRRSPLTSVRGSDVVRMRRMQVASRAGSRV